MNISGLRKHLDEVLEKGMELLKKDFCNYLVENFECSKEEALIVRQLIKMAYHRGEEAWRQRLIDRLIEKWDVPQE